MKHFKLLSAELPKPAVTNGGVLLKEIPGKGRDLVV